MNKQRKVVITTTYNELGIIIDTKTEELPSAQPEIIRCEYCAHRNQYRFPPKYEVKDYCEVHEKVTALNNFCSWADRR